MRVPLICVSVHRCAPSGTYGTWHATVTNKDGTTTEIEAPPAGIDLTAGRGYPSEDSNPETHGAAENWAESLSSIMRSIDTCVAGGSPFTDRDREWWREFESHETSSLQNEYRDRRTPMRCGWAALKAGSQAAASINAANTSAAEEQDALAQREAQQREAANRWTINPLVHTGRSETERRAAARAQAEQKEGETRAPLQSNELCMMVVDAETWRSYGFKVAYTAATTHWPRCIL